MIGSDLFVTAASIGGAKLPTDRVLDGGNLLAALEGREVERARPLYWRCPIAREPLKMALRMGDWKILADDSLQQFELYNLKDDPQEKTELSKTQPTKLAELKSAIIKLNAELKAEGPEWKKNSDDGEKSPSPKKAGKKNKQKAE